MTAGGCCDMHGRTCEPPSELCCDACTEAHHPWHADGSLCSNPDLSGMTLPDTTPPMDPTVLRSVGDLAADLVHFIDVWTRRTRPGPLEPDRD